MPLLTQPAYRPPLWCRPAHINTIYPALLRQVKGVHYERERLDLPDGDFLDIDWAKSARLESRNLVIVLHGLEGSSDRAYVRGMARVFNQDGWDAVALNFRGCSGELNRLPRSYHIGETGDLGFLIDTVIQRDYYQRIVLVGFSLGGNVVLRYLGEQAGNLPAIVKGGVAVSVPCHLPSANIAIDHWENYFYRRRFLRTLNAKLLAKAARFPDQIKVPEQFPRNFLEFDGYYTGPMHGFKSAEDYWQRNSSLDLLPQVACPVLIINAADDTFLSAACFPVAQAEASATLFLATPRWGGHVGFVTDSPQGIYYSEQLARIFTAEKISSKPHH